MSKLPYLYFRKGKQSIKSFVFPAITFNMTSVISCLIATQCTYPGLSLCMLFSQKPKTNWFRWNHSLRRGISEVRTVLCINWRVKRLLAHTYPDIRFYNVEQFKSIFFFNTKGEQIVLLHLVSFKP